ncbi:MAG: hypothetical protein HQM04_13020 [Magnetococcales bacterium]|nr:hypothetical protein [Magnetococcales bacterium]MBF0115948.1 hypothetical protein [Magnetococcales bacterium]
MNDNTKVTSTEESSSLSPSASSSSSRGKARTQKKKPDEARVAAGVGHEEAPPALRPYTKNDLKEAIRRQLGA